MPSRRHPDSVRLRLDGARVHKGRLRMWLLDPERTEVMEDLDVVREVYDRGVAAMSAELAQRTRPHRERIRTGGPLSADEAIAAVEAGVLEAGYPRAFLLTRCAREAVDEVNAVIEEREARLAALQGPIEDE